MGPQGHGIEVRGPATAKSPAMGDRSEQPLCRYAWGRADTLQWCGMAHLRLGERELAGQRLTAALELRERLGHGRIEEKRRP